MAWMSISKNYLISPNRKEISINITKMKLYIINIALLCCGFFGIGQTVNVDSLKSVITATDEPKLRSQLLTNLIVNHITPSRDKDYSIWVDKLCTLSLSDDERFECNRARLKLSLEKRQYSEHLKRAKQLLEEHYVQKDPFKKYRTIGYIIDNFYNQREEDSIIKYTLYAQMNLPEPAEEVYIFDRLAEMHYIKSDYNTATKYVDSALSLSNDYKNPKYRARALYRLAKIQRKTKFYDEALKNYQSSLNILLEKDSISLSIGSTYLEMGRLAKEMRRYTEAIDYLEKSYNVYNNLKRSRSLARIHDEFSALYIKLKDFEEAFYHAFQAVQLKNNINAKIDLKHSYSRLGRLYYLKKDRNIDKALYYLNLSKKLYEEKGTIQQKQFIELYISNAYKLKKDYKSALEHHYRYVTYKDSLQKITNNGLVADLEVKYETLKKENTILLKEEEISKQKITEQNLKIILLIIGLVSAILAGVAISLRRKTLQQKVILQKNMLDAQKMRQNMFHVQEEYQSIIQSSEDQNQQLREQLIQKEYSLSEVQKKLHSKHVLYDEQEFRLHLGKKYNLLSHPHLIRLWESIISGYTVKEYALKEKSKVDTVKKWRAALYKQIKQKHNISSKLTDVRAVIIYVNELRFFEQNNQPIGNQSEE